MQSNENLEIVDPKMDGGASEIIDETVAVPISTKKEDDKKTNSKSTDLEAATKMPPPAVILGPFAAPEYRPPSSIASERDEDEVLSLQVLSARSSTPYTMQAVCCNNTNCDLGSTDSSTVSPVKEETAELTSDADKKGVIDEKQMGQHSDEIMERKKYSRSDLVTIRDGMLPIVRPECFGSMNLKRLNLGKADGSGTNGGNRSKNHRASMNASNDMMPAFFKRKSAALTNSNGTSSTNHITYDSFKYNDSHPYNNHNDSGSQSTHRRIGSGRISNRDINWDYIPEEDPDKNNLPEFFNTKCISAKPQRQMKKFEPVINSGLVDSSQRSKNSHNSTTEERYSSSSTSNANNKSEEPEWFSCGPTSRLDTIELSGFNESDQQEIRIEMENAKKKPDANNNHEDPLINGGGHKEKKHLAFQFDDFSTHGAKVAKNTSGNDGNVAGTSSKISSSKFMPLFNAKRKEEEKPPLHNTSQSVNEFFKRNDAPPVQKDKKSMSEIPSVNEIEAKWRTQQQQHESRNKTVTENHRKSSENFKKMLNQLNQQQNCGVSVSPPPPPPPQQLSQPSLNLFNNDNLSNFIKQRNLQQQLLRKQQQQQAAFAQIQLNAILGRPDTQMLLLSLARGEISKQGLLVQLSNPNLTQADRDAITAVLTFSAAGQYHHQLAINSNHQQQHQFIANQLQNLDLLQQMNKNPNTTKRNIGGGGSGGSVFQANGSGSNVRTYSQEELQSHANYILHNAMMKKKLEEQTNLGMQKILQLQNSMTVNSNPGGNDTGSKSQQHQQQPHHYQHQQRQQKGSNAGGNRGNLPIGRRRSTSSSSSSNATINTSQMKLASDLEYRQIEQRRNTIATTSVGSDEFLQISQRI